MQRVFRTHTVRRGVSGETNDYSDMASPPTMADAMLNLGKITPERHRQMKAREQESAARSARAQAARARRRNIEPTINAADAAKYAGMVPPSALAIIKARRG